MQRTKAAPSSDRKHFSPQAVSSEHNVSFRPDAAAMGFEPASLRDVVPQGPGRQMEPAVRSSLERRLNWDLSRVRIHSGDEASPYTAYFGVPAYTVGNHIVIGDDRQRGTSDYSGLIGHEALHAAQQESSGASWHGRALSVLPGHDRAEGDARTFSSSGQTFGSFTPVEPCVAQTPPGNPQIVYTEREMILRRREIWNLALHPPPSPDPDHTENAEDNRYHSMRCFNRIRLLASRQQLPTGRTEEDYYTMLEELLNTPKALTTNNASPDLQHEAIALEAESIFSTPADSREEDLTASLPRGELPDGRRVEVLRRERRATDALVNGRFTIYLYRDVGDTGWYRQAHIFGRIHLEPAQTTAAGAAADQRIIQQITDIVQDIEDTAAGSSSGVTFDIDFVTTRGRGVTTFSIDSSRWPDSGNPWGQARTMVEELFHNIGMQDVYDYTVHATNDVYSIHTRLELFYRQLTKYGSDPTWRPDLPSITSGESSPSDFDYCQVIGTTPGRFRTCSSERGIPAAP